MLKGCELCSGSGVKIGLPVQYNDDLVSYCRTEVCKKCEGKGWYDAKKVISVSIEYIKDSYWER